MEDILGLAQQFAKEHSDGHFTLMKFTTNWRAAFYTPGSRTDIENMCVGTTAREAIQKAIKEKLTLKNLPDKRAARAMGADMENWMEGWQ